MKEKNVIIQLESKPKSLYSVITIVIFIIFLALAILLPLKFQSSPITAIALLFIPLAVLIFMFKIIIWNLFGKETIVIKKDIIESIFDYKYIYPTLRKKYKRKKFKVMIRTNSSSEELTLTEAQNIEKKNQLYKLVIYHDKDESFMTSKSFGYNKLSEIIKSIRT